MSAADRLPLEQSTALALLEAMLRIRHFEEKCAELYSQGKIHGFLHLYDGEEAVAAGLMPCLLPSDAVVCTYREHGHALMRGVPMNAVMAELYGKATGCSRGRGGSMHLFDAGRRFYGGNAIVAGGLPMAVGLALAERMQQRHGVVGCFFGDGAVAEGVFHESLNLAALWRLPVVFCCENNLYAMGTALARHQSQVNLAHKAASYGITAVRVDGMDARAVARTAREVVDAVRERGAPIFMELQTYRYRAHSMFDPELYRDASEVEAWKKRDPITKLQTEMQQAEIITADALQALTRRVDAEIEAAVRFAEESPLEPVSELTRFVYSHGGSHA